MFIVDACKSASVSIATEEMHANTQTTVGLVFLRRRIAYMSYTEGLY